MESKPDRNSVRFSEMLRSVGNFSVTTAGRLTRALAYGVAGGLVVLVVVLVVHLEGRPDLKIWHSVHLDEEFTTDSAVDSFEDYLALEERLFDELEHEVYERVSADDRTRINRYNRGSLADPGLWERDWNRSFEMTSSSARIGVLLLHGMSDSPYSLRALAETLNERGALVVGLRLPGHGTAPAGLIDVRWEDMVAAVQLGVRHVRQKVNGPVFVVGYSNGGSLAVYHALRTLRDEEAWKVDGIVLVSPAIGVSKVAAFAVWQGRLGRWLRLEKLAWNGISPEYDPFKYGSFAVNAGDLVYRLSGEVQKEISRSSEDDLRRLPPIVAFQSAVDATVVSSAVVDGLFNRLPYNGNELVLFDINRSADVEAILATDPAPLISSLLSGEPLAYGVSVVTNRNDESGEVILRVRHAGADRVETVELGASWPERVYSLSHVALPTPFDDPLYGGDPAVSSPGVRLGQLDFRGERGVLQVPLAAMLRLQWNPFYPWMERRILEFMGLDDGSSGLATDAESPPTP